MVASTSPRRRAATRERLLEAARHVLAETGIQGATVETICERAGFTRGAFYSNFESKDDLVVALFIRERDHMMARVQEAVDAEVGPIGDPSAVTRIIERFLTTYPNDRENFLIHQEFVIHGVRHAEIAGVYRELWQRTTEDLARVVAEAAEALGLELQAPPATLALLLHGAFETAVRTHFLESADDTFDGERLHDMIGALLLLAVPAQEVS